MNENNHDLNEFMYNVDIKKIVFVILAVNLNSIRFKIKKKIYTTKWTINRSYNLCIIISCIPIDTIHSIQNVLLILFVCIMITSVAYTV